MTDHTASPAAAPPSALLALKQHETFRVLLVQPWTYLTGAVLLAVLAGALLNATGSPWGVTTALTYWGAWAWGLVGGDPHSWSYFADTSPAFNKAGVNILNHAGSVIDIGLIFGAFAATLLASQFKIKTIKSSRQVWGAVLGGLLMGVGARMSFGCNIGALFSGVPSMSLHGWVFMVFIFLGAMIGSKLLVAYFIGAPSIAVGGPAATTAPAPAAAPAAAAGGGIKRIQRTRAPKKENTLQFPLGVVLIVALTVVGYVYAVVIASPMLAIFWTLGIALGFTLQRARFCFTAAMRDPVLTGGTNLTKAVVVALAVSTVLVSALQLAAYLKTGNFAAAAKIGLVSPVGVHTAVGAVMFGIGAVISGGCASGTLMRVGEGFVQQWISLPFFCIGGALGAATWPLWRGPLLVDMASGVYLPDLFGGFFPALVVQFVALFAVWFAADWWGKRATRA